MELKRYVLFKFNSENKIMTKESFLGQKRVDSWIAERGFVKTSDNIIDLIEVGDLVKGDGACIYASEVTEIYPEEVKSLFHLYWKNEIDTIWKKQPNGDYKRYEVK